MMTEPTTPAPLPPSLITYLAQRDAQHADAVRTALASLTDRERALIKDAAVMGYVRGTMHPKDERIPKDGQILAEVIDACLAFPDLYPAINSTLADSTRAVFAEVHAERRRQDEKWGEQNHPDGTGSTHQRDVANSARAWCKDAFGSGYGTWSDVLAEEVAEANAERDPARLRAELVQVAAVAAAWVEAIDRRAAQAEDGDTR
ncbi:hypothetical protein [Streptomyces antimycoticus]|uniref:hypothetical protein n=1 Tax=Streptomyces antimycoticus TaxID=68175 RepID=UPI0033F40E7B